MPSSQLYFWLGEGVKLLFMFAFGACVGSLVNVLVYRLPLGLSPISPPSRCPSCQTKLTWRENIPVFGWLLLRGKCRFCKARISPEYPLVEAFVALLFVLFYFLWYSVNEPVAPQGGVWAALQQVAPPWALSGIGATWPEFVTILVLLGALTAMTLVDAKTFTIPLSLAWFPTVVGAALLIGHVCVFQLRHPTVRWLWPGEWPWSIATPGRDGWSAIGASIGGILGLGVSNVLLAAGLFRRSFADYEAWEQSRLAAAPATPTAGEDVPGTPPEAGSAAEPPTAAPTDQAKPVPAQADLWIQYPHARREMLKEVVFLAPCILLAFLGAMLAHYWAGPWAPNPITLQPIPAVFAPLWLRVLSGVLLGYLIGGGVVWAVRILGSFAFGKEAMGLGDVHLMAAVGACLGWIDSTLAFFGAAFVGLGWAVLGRLGSGAFKRAMPYGPFLAISTLLVLLLKPLLEQAMSALLHCPIDLP